METKIRDFDSFEKKLDSILKPVSPEEDYIAKLKNRLFNEQNIAIEKPDYALIILLICSFFFFGIVLVWIINRLLNHKGPIKDSD